MSLTNSKDTFGCVHAQSTDVRHLTNDDFSSELTQAIERWKSSNVRGIWFAIDIKDSRFIQILAENDFKFHHAQESYVMMTRWLPEKQACTLPKYPHMQIGCGGIVVDAEDRVLVMREKKGHYLGWKFPGGLADPNENIYESAAREVREETGIEAVGEAVLSFRQVGVAKWANTGDIYFLIIMRPKDESRKDVTPCPVEAADAKWMTRDELSALPEELFHSTLRQSLDKYDEWKRSGQAGLVMNESSSPFRSRVKMHTFSVDFSPIKPRHGL